VPFLFGGNMAKRLTDTDKWKDEWYLSLPNDYKTIWQWLLDNCDHAGILKQGVGLLNLLCKTEISETQLLDIFKERVYKIENIYFIPKFLKFQYETLNSNKPVVISVIKHLEKHNLLEFVNGYFKNNLRMITEPLRNDYLTIKRKSKSKRKDKSIVKSKNDLLNTVAKNENFEDFRKEYPGTKRGLEIEFENFKNKHNDWEAVIPILLPALNKEKSYKDILKSKGRFCPEWKNLKTWLNQRCWEQEFGAIEKNESENNILPSPEIVFNPVHAKLEKLAIGTLIKKWGFTWRKISKEVFENTYTKDTFKLKEFDEDTFEITDKELIF